MVMLHDTRFVEYRWRNDGRTVKTVVTWRSSASMIPAPGFVVVSGRVGWPSVSILCVWVRWQFCSAACTSMWQHVKFCRKTRPHHTLHVVGTVTEHATKSLTMPDSAQTIMFPCQKLSKVNVCCAGMKSMCTVLVWSQCVLCWYEVTVFCAGMKSLCTVLVWSMCTVLVWSQCVLCWYEVTVYCAGMRSLCTVLVWGHCVLCWYEVVYCAVMKSMCTVLVWSHCVMCWYEVNVYCAGM